jgi:hypothetical protein
MMHIYWCALFNSLIVIIPMKWWVDDKTCNETNSFLSFHNFGYYTSPTCYIFIWHNICNLFSMQGQSATSNNPHGLPNPSPNQSSRPPRWCSSKLSHETCLCHILNVCGLIYMSTCYYCELFCGSCDFVKKHVIFVSYVVCLMYVMILWYLWCICDDYVIYLLFVWMK